ncbi:uncharacterized protein EAE97_011133 [Botrytis byssoidea]|uniref:Uncharacterized protein n=1 Tax=Botrytis byssoidea TaxID=139641 RepID=A0A9P5HXP0_9HELO|nr:uncharacterized protein EAE97_011133 [Botrytis byssoidea]KAF7922391.1 hypothetical protein EAE97_011133 [Botrytis byssoidea]
MSFFLNTFKSTLALVGIATPQVETSTPAAPTSSNAILSGEYSLSPPLLIDYSAEDPSFTSDFAIQAPVPTNTGHILTGILRPGLRPSTVIDRMQIHGFPRTLENWKVCPSAPLTFKFKKIKAKKNVHFREYHSKNFHQYRPFDPEEPADSWIPYDDAILHQPNQAPGVRLAGSWTCPICKNFWCNTGNHNTIPGLPGWEWRDPPLPCPEHPRPLSFRKPEPFYGLALSQRELIYSGSAEYKVPYTLHGGLINPPAPLYSEDDLDSESFSESTYNIPSPSLP